MSCRVGLTFLEVLVATFILGTAVMSILWFVSNTHAGVRATLGEIQASNLASQIVETFQSLPPEVISNVDGPLPDALPPAFFDKAGKAGFRIAMPPIPSGYKVNLTISSFETPKSIPPTLPPPLQEKSALAAQLLLIDVKVGWTEQGRLCEIRLKSAIGGT